MMKTITKFMTLCALFVGVNVSAQTTVFEKGTAEKPFVDADVANAVKESVVDGNMVVTGKNESHECSFSVVPQTYDNSLYTIEVVMTAGTAPGRDSSYDYWNFGPISVRWNGQKAESLLLIDGVESKISTNKTLVRGVSYSVKATINTATGEVRVSVTPGTSSELAFTGVVTSVDVDYTNFKFGHYRGGAEGYEHTIVLDEVVITQKEVIAETASYAVKFVDGNGVDIKEAETRTGVVDAGINIFPTDKESFFNSDKTKKYFYVSDDSEGKTIASNGSSVVTITYREAETYSYSVKSSTGITIAEGSNFEGESITIPYPMYVNEDGVLYQADTEKDQYNHVFTLTTDVQEEVITYNETEIVDVVMLVEAETLLGMTPSAGNGGTATIRSSNAKVAYPAEDVQIITIPAGKYRIVVDIYGGQKAPGELTMTIDEASHTFTSVSSTYHSIQSWDVELTKEESPLMALKGGGNGVAYDFIYIIKTGNVTPISDINADKAVDNDYYDLSGRKVVNPVKGNIYINGGKLIRY